MSITTGLGLIDHHCHGLLEDNLSPDEFRSLATESDWLSEPGLETLDSPFGLMIRSICAPLLDLPKHAPIDEYIARRIALGAAEVNERLMTFAGTSHFVMDTGFVASDVMSPEQMSSTFDAPSSEIVRLERVAEGLVGRTDASSFAADFAAALREATVDAVGVKSVIAYRYGLDVADTPPTTDEVRVAAGEWLATAEQTGSSRLEHPVLLVHLIWEAVQLGKPIQFHVGFGDSDVELYRSDPSRLTRFLDATRTSGAKIMLLHCYPFVREAASLAHIFPHVYLDVGEVSHYLGPSSRVAIRQSYEIAPFHKVLYSSDAYGLAEHYAVSSAAWRRETASLVEEWIADDWLSASEAERIVKAVASGNASRVYGLGS